MRILSYLLLTVLLAFVAASVLSPSFTSAQEAKKEEAAFKYVGATLCKPCHQTEAQGKIFAAWEASAHAKAWDKLGAANQANEKCLGCHTTGHGKTLAAGKTADVMHGVQCEACHGPGSEYKTMSVMKVKADALKKGLVDPDAKVCAGCHTAELPKECWGAATAAPKFDFAAAYKKIEHRVPKAPAPAK
jgi:hypothetical protein